MDYKYMHIFGIPVDQLSFKLDILRHIESQCDEKMPLADDGEKTYYDFDDFFNDIAPDLDTKFLKRKRRNLHHKTFDREFCYNLDVNLAKIIARALKAYEKTVVGVPNDLCYAVVDGELKKIRTMDEAIEYWHKLLKQMIWSFKEIGKGRPHEPTMRDLEWKDYKQQMDKYDKKVQRGIDLFAEYYQGLWI